MDEDDLASIVSGLHNCGPVIGRQVAREFLASGVAFEHRPGEFPYPVAKWCVDRIKVLKAA
jgi:hypothetical protein